MVEVLHKSKASPRAKLVLLGIANHEGDNGAYPSIKTLATYANASERSVKRDIQELVSLGELSVEKQAAPVNNQYKPNLYWVTLSGVTDRASGVTAEVTGVTGESRLEASGVTGEVSRGDSVGTQNLINLNKESSIDKSSLSTKTKASYLDPFFEPRQESWEAMHEHFPHIDLKLETHSFIDYWTSKTGKDAMKKDWDATWRNWIRSAHRRMMLSPSYKKLIDQQNREEEIRRMYESEGN